MTIQRPIQTNVRGSRQIHGRITNAGSAVIAAGEGFTAVYNGTGLVTITLTKPSRSLLSAVASVINATTATGHSAKAITVTDLGVVQFGTYVADGVDGALVNVNFSFIITVKDVSL
jgi:hypothetical protein